MPMNSSAASPSASTTRPQLNQKGRLTLVKNASRLFIAGGQTMAKYGKAAGKSVKSAVQREKGGTLKSGKGGKGGTVKSRKQAIAIGLSEARKKGAKVPKKKSA
jgi:hypothetical protein